MGFETASSECTTKVESIIKTGMELKKAEEILMNFGAQEAQLQSKYPPA